MVEYVKLGDVCEITGGYAFKSESFQDVGVPIIRISNLKDDSVIIDDSVCYPESFWVQHPEYRVEKENILIALSGATVGKIGLYNSDILTLLNQRVGKIVVDTNKLNNQYLYHYLKSEKFGTEIKKLSCGCAQPNISIKQVCNISLPYHKVEKQQRIAKVLDAICAIILKRKRQIALLDNAVKSLFVEMFGDPVENPMGWESVELKTLSTKITSGNTPVGGSKVYVSHGIMFFRSQNVWKNRFELDDIVYIDEQTHKKMNDTRLKHGDILITKTGRFNTENSSLGRAALFIGEDDSANINGHVYLVRLGTKKVLTKFVLHILISDSYKQHIRRVCVGGIDKRQLNKNHIEEFPIIIPPLDLQKEFAARVEKIETHRRQLEVGLSKMEEAYGALMQEYFG